MQRGCHIWSVGVRSKRGFSHYVPHCFLFCRWNFELETTFLTKKKLSLHGLITVPGLRKAPETKQPSRGQRKRHTRECYWLIRRWFCRSDYSILLLLKKNRFKSPHFSACPNCHGMTSRWVFFVFFCASANCSLLCTIRKWCVPRGGRGGGMNARLCTPSKKKVPVLVPLLQFSWQSSRAKYQCQTEREVCEDGWGD